MNRKLALIALVPFALQAETPVELARDLLHGDHGEFFGATQKFVIRPAARQGANHVAEKVIDKNISNKILVEKGSIKIGSNDFAKWVAHVLVRVGGDFIENEQVNVKEAVLKRSLIGAIESAGNLALDLVAPFIGLDDINWNECFKCPVHAEFARRYVADLKYAAYETAYENAPKKSAPAA